MNKLLNRLEKVKYIMYYFWIFLLLCAATFFWIGHTHYEREKQDQYDLLILQSQLYLETSKMYVDSAKNGDYQPYFNDRAIYYQDISNRLADSAKTILNQ